MNLTHLRGYALILRFFLIIIVVLPLNVNVNPLNVNANSFGWRGIKPIHSTCKEVEREFGGDACGKMSATYDLPNENVAFVFSQDGCNGKWPTQPYNVPTGTVVGISVLLKAGKRLTIADLKIDISKFEKTEIGDMVGAFKYISREVGMYITASEEGQVTDFAYVPAASYDNLRCPPPTESNPLDKLLKCSGNLQ